MPIYAHHSEIRVSANGASGPFEPIAEIEGDIPFPEIETELQETTVRGSSNRRRWGTGLEDSPELSVTILYDPNETSHQTLIQHQREKTAATYQFAVVDHNTGEDVDVWQVAMLVRRFAPTSPSGGYYRANVTFKPTGDLEQNPNAGDGDGDGS